MRVTSPLGYGLRRRRPRWHTSQTSAPPPELDSNLLNLARQVLYDHNIGVAVACDRGIIVFEHLHERGHNGHCIECTAIWPCSMERLRVAVAQLDR